MRTEIATVTERERDIVFNATHIKLYIRAVEKKPKQTKKKKQSRQTRQRKNSKRALLFITMKVLRANATNINNHEAEKKKLVLSLLLIE